MITLLQRHGKVAKLDHRAFHWPRGSKSMFATGSKDGSISICHLARAPAIASMRAPTETRALSVHPSGERLALIADDGGDLIVLEVDGSIRFRAVAPRRDEATPQWVDRGYSDCWFDRDGSHLWTAAHVSESIVAVEVRETSCWTIVARSTLDDTFGGSHVSFHPTPNAGGPAIWVAAGQDGQNLFWVERIDSELRCTLEPSLHNAPPPSFSPTGRECLAVTETGILQRLSYPNVQVEAEIESPYGPDAVFDSYACYVDERHALVLVQEGRLAAIDTVEMRVLDEVAIEDHEPKATQYYYPTLVGDLSLCTDISYFFAVGDTIAFVHRTDRGTSLDDWKDGILYFQAKSISDQLRTASGD